MPVDTRRLLHRPRAQAGFTVIELAIVIILMGLLIAPLIRLAASSVGATRVQQTQAALETARDALIAYAAVNKGCLPFAADFEGGLSDTDASGSAPPGYVDTGIGSNPAKGGDLPWADLGLTNSFLDGDGLRIQYYVAHEYASNDIGCAAGFRGFEWNANVTYSGSGPNPLYVYYTPIGLSRTLYKVIATLPGGTSPNALTITCVGPNDPLPECVATEPITVTEDVTDPMTNPLLPVRRGPDVHIAAGAPQTDAISLQNVFVLIAPGRNRNATYNRTHIRDSNHLKANVNWPIDAPGVNTTTFSITPNVDATDSGNDGDDTLLVTSFIQYKAALSAYGLNMEPICDGGC